MIDPIQRSEKLENRMHDIMERFKKLPYGLTADESHDLHERFNQMEGNEEIPVGAWYLERWLYNHGV